MDLEADTGEGPTRPWICPTLRTLGFLSFWTSGDVTRGLFTQMIRQFSSVADWTNNLVSIPKIA